MTHIYTIARHSPTVLGAPLVMGALACREDAGSPTSPELRATLESTPAVALSFRQVSAGRQSCALTPFGRAFCWGANSRGQLGDNTLVPRPTPVRVVGGLIGDGTINNRRRPTLVAGAT